MDVRQNKRATTVGITRIFYGKGVTLSYVRGSFYQSLKYTDPLINSISSRQFGELPVITYLKTV